MTTQAEVKAAQETVAENDKTVLDAVKDQTLAFRAQVEAARQKAGYGVLVPNPTIQLMDQMFIQLGHTLDQIDAVKRSYPGEESAP